MRRLCSCPSGLLLPFLLLLPAPALGDYLLESILDETLEPNLDPAFNRTLYCVDLASDGTVWANGGITPYLYRVEPDGSIEWFVTLVGGQTFGLQADDQGRVYLAGITNDVVRRLGAFDEADEFRIPGEVTDILTPSLLDSFGTSCSAGVGGTCLDGPYWVRVLGDFVYVSGTYSHNLLRVELDAAGAPIDAVELIGPDSGLLAPQVFDLGPDGTVYLAGYGSDNAFRIAPDGTITLLLDGVANPRGIGVAPDGSVYVASFSGHQLWRIPLDAAGDPLPPQLVFWDGKDGVDFYFPRNLRVDADGNVWVVNHGRVIEVPLSNVVKVAPDGTGIEVLGPDGVPGHAFAYGLGIAVRPDGRSAYASNEATGDVTTGVIRICADSDGDGVCDVLDACEADPSPAGGDLDGDGFGDACDPDYDQDGIVGLADLSILAMSFGRSSGEPGFDPATDHDRDGITGLPDFSVLAGLLGGAPGPSGLDCADATLCTAGNPHCQEPPQPPCTPY